MGMSFDLLGIYGAGLLTFVTPCVLPMIPLYLAALVGTDIGQLDRRGRGRLITRAAFFSAGFMAVFTAMGLGASSLGAFLSDHRGALQLLGGLLLLLFGLKLIGAIEVPLLDRTIQADGSRLSRGLGPLGALGMGVVFAAGWSPCVGPVLGSVLGYTAASTSDPLVGAGYLALYGAGFATPLMLTAVFAEGMLGLLARVRRHLPRIERVTGALMLIVAATLLTAALRDGANPGATSVDTPPLASLRDGPAVPMMVELYAEDCPSCQRMKPVVDELVEQCDQKGVRVEAIDVGRPENSHLVDRYRVVGVPTFLFIDEAGAEVARLVGEQTPETLRRALSAVRGEECPGLAVIERPEKTFEEEQSSCRSTNTAAIVATNSSRSSAPPETRTRSSVPAASSPPESCSVGSL